MKQSRGMSQPHCSDWLRHVAEEHRNDDHGRQHAHDDGHHQLDDPVESVEHLVIEPHEAMRP
jgi:hypothetical protein